jgi:hypothetical protein
MIEKAQTYGSKNNLGLVMIWFEFSKKKKKTQDDQTLCKIQIKTN